MVSAAPAVYCPSANESVATVIVVASVVMLPRLDTCELVKYLAAPVIVELKTPLMVSGALKLVMLVLEFDTAFALNVNALGPELKLRASVSEPAPVSVKVIDLNVEGRFLMVSVVPA